MASYEGISDDKPEAGESTFRLYIDTTDGSYVDIRPEDVTSETAVDVPGDVQHWRIDVRDGANYAVRKVTGDEWKPLFEAAADPSRTSAVLNRLIETYRGPHCPRETTTRSFRTCLDEC